jgi:hypothetical protein
MLTDASQEFMGGKGPCTNRPSSAPSRWTTMSYFVANNAGNHKSAQKEVLA